MTQSPATPPEVAHEVAPVPVPTWPGALAGTVAVGVALGLTELLAGLIRGVPSAISSIGAVIVGVSPPALKDGAVAVFGTNDKPALAIGTVVIALIVGSVLGRRAAIRFSAAIRGFVAFALIGVAAMALDVVANTVLGALVIASSAGIGLVVLRRLLQLAHARTAAGMPPLGSAADPDGRRRFIGAALVTGAAALVGGAFGRIRRTAAPRIDADGLALPDPAGGVAPPGPAQGFDVAGLTPVVVPNDRFYRIDTALIVPRVDPAEWTLRVHGLVERELTFTLDDIYAREQVERYVTIACVSNEVGGRLVGNAAWQGVRLAPILEEAGVVTGAGQVVGRSIDNWTSGFPLEAVSDGRDPIIAVAMNGEPLPADHGYPARLIVPGLYGYVSATKWLTEIELTTWEDFDAYWVPRGWSKEGPMKLQSRIDVPRSGALLGGGPNVIAGVAWAGLAGISKVEIAVDDGPWMPTELSQPLSEATWVQWRTTITLDAGRHRVEVRATDASGNVQTDQLAPPRPDGATGHHVVTFRSG